MLLLKCRKGGKISIKETLDGSDEKYENSGNGK